MPKVALNAEQRRRNAAGTVYKDLLDRLNEKRGRDRKTNQEFAAELGVSERTWRRWNNGGISKAEFGVILDAALRAGIRLEVVA